MVMSEGRVLLFEEEGLRATAKIINGAVSGSDKSCIAVG